MRGGGPKMLPFLAFLGVNVPFQAKFCEIRLGARHHPTHNRVSFTLSHSWRVNNNQWLARTGVAGRLKFSVWYTGALVDPENFVKIGSWGNEM